MRFKYRNVVTGAEFESNSIVSAPNLIKVEAETTLPKVEPEPEVKAEPKKAEPKAKAATKTKAQKTKATAKKGAKK